MSYFEELTAHYRDVRARLDGRPAPPAPLTIPTGWDVVEPESEPESEPEPPPPPPPPDPLAGAPCSPDTKRAIAAITPLTWAEIVAKDHGRARVLIRAQIYVLLRERGWSYLRIARLFERDHTTIISSIQRHQKGTYK
jgi:hypothetical protein